MSVSTWAVSAALGAAWWRHQPPAASHCSRRMSWSLVTGRLGGDWARCGASIRQELVTTANIATGGASLEWSGVLGVFWVCPLLGTWCAARVPAPQRCSTVQHWCYAGWVCRKLQQTASKLHRLLAAELQVHFNISIGDGVVTMKSIPQTIQDIDAPCCRMLWTSEFSPRHPATAPPWLPGAWSRWTLCTLPLLLVWWC